MIELILAASDPSDMLRNDQGFRDWIFYGIAALMLWSQIKGLINGDKPKDIKLSGGKIQTEATSRVATLADVDELREELDELRAENESMHRASREAGEKRVSAIAEVMAKETGQIDRALQSLTTEVKDLTEALHDKVNRIASDVATHGGQLPLLLRSVERVTSAVEGTNKRIDDLVRLSAE